MPGTNDDLLVNSNETFDSWRGKFNVLAERTSNLNEIGSLGSIDQGIPEDNKTSFVAALNYIYGIRVSDGQPLTNSTFTNCLVPNGTSIYYGGYDQAYIKAVAGTYGSDILIGFGENVQTVTFKYNGRVGVLTDDPQFPLHCNGTAQVNELIVKNPVTQKGISIRNTDVSGINYLVFDPDSNVILNNSTHDMIINRGGGKVGIGYDGTESLIDNLSVRSSTVTSSMLLATGNNDSVKLSSESAGASLSVNGTQRLRITSTGKFGINQNTPTYDFEVNGSIFGSSVVVGSTLLAGSSTVLALSGDGQTTITLTSSGSLKHGTTTIVDTDGKIDWGRIKNFTLSINTDGVAEGATNKYFTDSRAITAVSGGTLTNLTVSSAGTIKHGTTTIVDTDGKIDWGRIKSFTINTDGVSEGATNKYFTDSRAITAISSGTLTNLTVSSAGTIKHGATVIVDTDAKIDWGRIKNFTLSINTDSVSEGATNKYFTNARAITAVSTIDVPGITLTDVLTLSGYSTGLRPTGVPEGSVIYDTSANIPIYYDGTSWKKFDGTAA